MNKTEQIEIVNDALPAWIEAEGDWWNVWVVGANNHTKIAGKFKHYTAANEFRKDYVKKHAFCRSCGRVFEKKREREVSCSAGCLQVFQNLIRRVQRGKIVRSVKTNKKAHHITSIEIKAWQDAKNITKKSIMSALERVLSKDELGIYKMYLEGKSLSQTTRALKINNKTVAYRKLQAIKRALEIVAQIIEDNER